MQCSPTVTLCQGPSFCTRDRLLKDLSLEQNKVQNALTLVLELALRPRAEGRRWCQSNSVDAIHTGELCWQSDRRVISGRTKRLRSLGRKQDTIQYWNGVLSILSNVHRALLTQHYVVITNQIRIQKWVISIFYFHKSEIFPTLQAEISNLFHRQPVSNYFSLGGIHIVFLASFSFLFLNSHLNMQKSFLA